MRHSLIFATVAVLIAGCSDPKAANEKNFKISIQKNLDAAQHSTGEVLHLYFENA